MAGPTAVGVGAVVTPIMAPVGHVSLEGVFATLIAPIKEALGRITVLAAKAREATLSSSRAGAFGTRPSLIIVGVSSLEGSRTYGARPRMGLARVAAASFPAGVIAVREGVRLAGSGVVRPTSSTGPSSPS